MDSVHRRSSAGNVNAWLTYPSLATRRRSLPGDGLLTPLFILAVALGHDHRLWLSHARPGPSPATVIRYPAVRRQRVGEPNTGKAADSPCEAAPRRIGAVVDAALTLVLTIGGGIAAVDAPVAPHPLDPTLARRPGDCHRRTAHPARQPAFSCGRTFRLENASASIDHARPVPRRSGQESCARRVARPGPR